MNNKDTSKTLMAKLISLLLNYPSLADGTVEVRVRHIKQSEVLLELVHLAQIDKNISKEDLIKPFKSQANIYRRLKELCYLEPHLSEFKASNEFLECLNDIERHQKNTLIKEAISRAKTADEERKVMMNIQKGDLNKV